VQEDDARFAAWRRPMGVRGALQLPSAFEGLLRGCGVKIALTGEGHDELRPELLRAADGAAGK